MRPSDLFLYLIGNRAAIERIAASRSALWAGALLVLSAGIARNYDHLFLPKQYEWFVGPFGMSLFSASVIWLLLAAGISFLPKGNKVVTFRTFLTLFWLTAPCAWLYGIPVEQFTDLVHATQWNFAFLIVVSLWRMALIIRAVTVLTGAAVGRVLTFVLLPASIEMAAGSLVKTLSLVGIMGGVRLPPHHEFLRQATEFVMVGSFWTAIAAFLAVVAYSATGRGRSINPLFREVIPTHPWVFKNAALSLTAWTLFAIPYQGPVSRTLQLRELFQSGKWSEGIRFASQFQREDFSMIQSFLPTYSIEPFSDTAEPLLKALDGREPEWFRQECITFVTDLLDLKMSYHMQESPYPQILKRYPEIEARLSQKATLLRSIPEPSREDTHWLMAYDQFAELLPKR